MIVPNRAICLQHRRVEISKGSNGVPVLERAWYFKDAPPLRPGGEQWTEDSFDLSYIVLYPVVELEQREDETYAG